MTGVARNPPRAEPAAAMAGTQMSIASLGAVFQLAFVPRDFDAALLYWTKTLGVGPFFEMKHISVPQIWYRGTPTKFDFSLALGYWGDVQIELIQQHDDIPSIYTDWLQKGGEGLHHVCQLVDDMDRAKAVCAHAGAAIVQELALDEGHAIYVETGGGPGTMFEFIKAPPGLLEAFAMIKAASRAWDGRNPVRPLG